MLALFSNLFPHPSSWILYEVLLLSDWNGQSPRISLDSGFWHSYGDAWVNFERNVKPFSEALACGVLTLMLRFNQLFVKYSSHSFWPFSTTWIFDTPTDLLISFLLEQPRCQSFMKNPSFHSWLGCGPRLNPKFQFLGFQSAARTFLLCSLSGVLPPIVNLPFLWISPGCRSSWYYRAQLELFCRSWTMFFALSRVFLIYTICE